MVPELKTNYLLAIKKSNWQDESLYNLKMEEQSFEAANMHLALLDPYNVLEIRDHIRPKTKTFRFVLLDKTFTLECPPDFFENMDEWSDMEKISVYLAEREIEFEHVDQYSKKVSFGTIGVTGGQFPSFQFRSDPFTLFGSRFGEEYLIQITYAPYTETIKIPLGPLRKPSVPVRNAIQGLTSLFKREDSAHTQTFRITFEYSDDYMTTPPSSFTFPFPFDLELSFHERKVNEINTLGPCDIRDKETALELVKSSLFLQMFASLG